MYLHYFYYQWCRDILAMSLLNIEIVSLIDEELCAKRIKYYSFTRLFIEAWLEELP